ncbi:unnamed protein product [Linum trigynum]|uniref:Uncharacterized protein n=1 Tax=Linum trigynum TaxID=586398 RepID=A0AAV2E6X0_9ROSI
MASRVDRCEESGGHPDAHDGGACEAETDDDIVKADTDDGEDRSGEGEIIDDDKAFQCSDRSLSKRERDD